MAAICCNLILARMLPPNPLRRSWDLRIPLLTTLAVLTYAGTLGNDFAFDDTPIVRDNPLLRHGDWTTLLTSDYWAGYHGDRSGLYRPLTMLSYALQLRISGSHPLPFHLLNILLHAACTLGLYGLVRRLCAHDTALWSAALFAVHPACSESICAVVGRADLLAAAFGLLAARFHLGAAPRQALAAAAALLLALLSKESAIALFALLPLIDLFQYRLFLRKCYSLSYLLYAGIAGLYLAWRYYVLGTLTLGEIDPFDNPLVGAEPAMRIYDAVAIAFRYLGLLVLPAHLSADYSYAALTPSAAFEIGPLVGIGLGLSALIFLLYKSFQSNSAVFFGLGWFCIALAPVSNILIPIGTVMGERLLYLPAMGFCVALAAQLQTIRRYAPPIALLLVTLFATRSAVRTSDWRDNYTLFQEATRVQPQSARAWRGLGNAAMERQQRERALISLGRALRIHPDYYEVHVDLAHHYLSIGQPDIARRHLATSLQLRADYPPAWFALGLVLYKLGEKTDAARAFEQALQLDPSYADAAYNLGVIQLDSGQPKRAQTYFQRTLTLDPEHERARSNLEAAKKMSAPNP